MISGGAGRVVAAIPALLKYVRTNPSHDVKITIGSWDCMYWSIPELQNITFPLEVKGEFHQFFLNADEVVSPEPYHLPSYYRQEASLAEAFDEIINNTKDHSDLECPKIYMTAGEKAFAASIANGAKQQQKKEKTIVIQPFGRSTETNGEGVVFDNSSRSMEPDVYLELVRILSEKYNLILMAEPHLHLVQDHYTLKPNLDTRGLVCLVGGADYFIGCDSVGQHIARALDKPGTVIFGSTFPRNTSYPDHFQIIENDADKVYSPLRINLTDCNFADRINAECMKYSPDDIVVMAKQITDHLESSTRVVKY